MLLEKKSNCNLFVLYTSVQFIYYGLLMVHTCKKMIHKHKTSSKGLILYIPLLW